MKFFAGFVGVSAIVFGFLYEGGHLDSLLQMGSFIIVVGPTVFLSLAHHSSQELKSAFKAALAGEPIPYSLAARHAAVLSTPRIIATAAGGVGFLLGLIHTMTNLGDPSKLGAGIAVSFLAIFYGLVLSELMVAPMISRVSTLAAPEEPEKKLPEDEGKETPGTGGGGGAKLIYALLGVAMILWGYITQGGHMGSLLHVGGLIIVVGASIFLSLAHHSWGDFRAALNAVRSPDTLPSAEVNRHAAVLATPRLTAMALGGVGFIWGLIFTMQNLDDPSKLGGGIAVAFVSALYALAFSEFAVGPLVNRVLARAESKPARNLADSNARAAMAPTKPNFALGLFSTLGCLLCFFVVLYAITKVDANRLETCLKDLENTRETLQTNPGTQPSPEK